MSPKLRLTGTQVPIEFGSESLTAQDSKTKAEASFLFGPANSIPINKAPFGILQVTAPKKFVRKSIKLLKKIHRGSLNHTTIYGKSLNHRL